MRRTFLLTLTLPFLVSLLRADITFEGFPDSTILTNQIPGLTFTNTIILKSQYSLNEQEFPPHSGVNVAADFNGPITIEFSQGVLYFTGYFTYTQKLTLEAYDSTDTLLPGLTEQSDFNNNTRLSGDPRSSPNELISVGDGTTLFQSVEIEGNPNGYSFTMDDVSHATPEPAAFLPLLLLMGAGVGMKLRKRGVAGIGIALLFAAAPLSMRAAPGSITATITPGNMPANTATAITVSTTIVDPTLIQTGILLQETNAAGTITNPNLGSLTAAGGNVYSITLNFNRPAGQIYLQVSAPFRNTILRVRSNLLTLQSGPAPALAIQSVSFGGITIRKDLIGSANPITAPQWTAAPAKSDPVAYTAGDTMSVDLTFTLNPVPKAPIPNVTIQGVITGPTGPTRFSKAGVTLPAAATATVTDIDANAPLTANKSQFSNPMMITWSYVVGAATTNLGATQHQLYVTLAAPLNTNVYLTDLYLGVGNGGDTTAAAALRSTWSRYSAGGAGPANITAWNNRQLVYYPAGTPFGGCALDEEELLISATGGGQCGSFAYLLAGSLNVNGIGVNGGTPDAKVTIEAINGDDFLVNNWTYAAVPSCPRDPNGYTFQLTLNAMAVMAGDIMVPAQPGGVYGDLTSNAGLAGQNSPTPSEKIFTFHFIIKPDPPLDTQYYDPSYGVTYANAAAFETAAVAGYVEAHVAGDPANVFRVMRFTPPPPGFVGPPPPPNIKFSR